MAVWGEYLVIHGCVGEYVLVAGRIDADFLCDEAEDALPVTQLGLVQREAHRSLKLLAIGIHTEYTHTHTHTHTHTGRDIQY